MDENLTNILALLDRGTSALRLLDLECDDSARTMPFAEAVGTRMCMASSLCTRAHSSPHARGTRVHVGDLADPLPNDDRNFDLVAATRLLEHLSETEALLSELPGVVAPGLCA
jgi:hypothetical protein